MTNCTGCNEPIDKYPAYEDAWGGDWYASCSICEWHCEGEERTTIKQGLTLEELVAHKKKLNRLYNRLHRYTFTNSMVRDRQEPEQMLDELKDIMKELIEEDE